MNTSIPGSGTEPFSPSCRKALYRAHRVPHKTSLSRRRGAILPGWKTPSARPYPLANRPAGDRRGAPALRVHAEAMDNTARALERTAANFNRDRAELRGVGAVAASGWSAPVLPPLVARLRQACPNVVIELMLSIGFRICFTGRRMSRCGWSPRSGAAYRPPSRLGIELGLHATAAYLTRQGLPATLDDLASHANWFDSATPSCAGRCWAPRFQREAFAMRTDNDLAQLSLIRAGAGSASAGASCGWHYSCSRCWRPTFSLYLDAGNTAGSAPQPCLQAGDFSRPGGCRRIFVATGELTRPIARAFHCLRK